MNGNESIEIGIVGLGAWGATHATKLKTSDADLVGGVDIASAARERFEDDFDVPTYEGLDGLTEAGVDGIVITTPNRFHEGYATAAFEAGLDVLVEKPLAHTLESAQRIANAAAASDSISMVGFKNRFLASVEVAKGYQRAGRFGDVSHVEANYVRRRGVPGRGSWFTERASAGGGALVDIGVHAIDLALYLLDFPEVETVLAKTRTEFGDREDYTYLSTWTPDNGPEGFDVDDSVTALIECANGATVALETAWAANRDPNDDFVLRGTDAGATIDRMTDDLVINETSHVGRPHFINAAVETTDVDPLAAEQRRFIEAIRDREPPRRNTLEQAVVVQSVIDAIQRSSERGGAVSPNI